MHSEIAALLVLPSIVCCLAFIVLPFRFALSGAFRFAGVVRFARDYALRQLAIFCYAARRVAADVRPDFDACETAQRRILPRAIAAAASRHKVRRVVAATVAVRHKVVKRDVLRMRAVEVGQAIDAGETVTKVDSEAKVGANLHAAVAALAVPSVACCFHFRFLFCCFRFLFRFVSRSTF